MQYWHFNVAFLSDNVYKNAYKKFLGSNYRKTNAVYSSLQQWWDVGKGRIKQLCLQYTLNVTRDMSRSIKALQREIVGLQTFTDSTGEREHILIIFEET